MEIIPYNWVNYSKYNISSLVYEILPSDHDHNSPTILPVSNITKDPCSEFQPTQSLDVRFYTIGILGATVCTLGIIFNIILLKILLRASLRTTYLSYLAALAVIDINIAVTYIMVMCVAIWYEYYSNYFLYHIWHIFLPYFYTLSRIATMASSYLVVACTAERYLEVVQIHANRTYVQITCTKRYVVIVCVLAATVAFRIIVYWELQVSTLAQCEGTFSYYGLDQTWLVKNVYYSTIYSFYSVHIVQVFFPFMALLFLNLLIVRTWRVVLSRDTIPFRPIEPDRQALTEGEQGAKFEQDEYEKRVKCAQSARSMMAAIVVSYLSCNLLNVILTFYEHIDYYNLKYTHSVFYSFASDTVTLLTTVNASFRLPIYYATNLRIRSEVKKMLIKCCTRRDPFEWTHIFKRKRRQLINEDTRNGQSDHNRSLGVTIYSNMLTEVTPLFKQGMTENGTLPDENEADF